MHVHVHIQEREHMHGSFREPHNRQDSQPSQDTAKQLKIPSTIFNLYHSVVLHLKWIYWSDGQSQTGTSVVGQQGENEIQTGKRIKIKVWWEFLSV